MAEPIASPQMRLTAPSAPMLMVMTGVSGWRSAISAVAASRARTSRRLWGMTASLGRSAPEACMAHSRAVISAWDGVLAKSWLEQTTAVPWAWAWAIRPGSPAPAVKNSMSTRSAQPLSHTRRQKAAYSGKAAFARPPSAWVRRVTSSSLSPRTARSPVRQRERAAASRQPANQSARNSMQSAASWANACPCARTACSVSSTIGRMTLGRPCPMTQPRTVMQDIKIHARFLLYIITIITAGRGGCQEVWSAAKKFAKRG